MDADHFDHLSRSFSTLLTRRTLTGLLGLGVAILPPFAAAKKRRKKKKTKCGSGTKKCGRTCIPATGCCSSSECGANGTCVGNICRCNSGFKDCDGECIPEDQCCTDDDCAANETCDSGACVCRAEQVCEDVCCPLGEFCVGDVCQGAGTCEVGENVCKGDVGCNGDNTCDCLTRFTDDSLICGNLTDCSSNCTDDVDCPGAGGFCAKKVGQVCCTGIPGGQGMCALPCPA
jgi:hypothetical protein